jgi:hypothetical protein
LKEKRVIFSWSAPPPKNKFIYRIANPPDEDLNEEIGILFFDGILLCDYYKVKNNIEWRLFE